jgi:3-hydroxyisobutyrate dehydrogenase
VTRLRIGWIGTGVMGAPMAGHLLAAGYRVSVFNRTRGRADDLVEDGAGWRDTPAELAADSDAVFLMLGYPADVSETVLGDGGVLGDLAPGSLLIDMTTSEPALAQEIHRAAVAKGVHALDAPVSGGDLGARNATLVIMVGGEPEAYAQALPLLSVLGQTIVHQGAAGCGQQTKVMNQIAIAAGMIGICEALVYAHRAALDLERAIDTIKGGAAGSWSLTNYGPRLLRGDLEPGFKVDHFIKDLGIALSDARRLGVSLPGTALAQQLYVAAASQGLGQKGTHALAVAVAGLSGERWPADG